MLFFDKSMRACLLAALLVLAASQTPRLSRSDECDVEFIVLQKDAYMSDAGRNLKPSVFPPHTTTVLRVHCRGKAPIVHESKNHGTGQDDLHPQSGQPMLSKIKTRSVKASFARAEKLLSVMRGCSCDNVGGTKFLSIDSVDKAAMARLTLIASTELRCPTTKPREVFLELIAGRSRGSSDLVAVQDDIEKCTWKGGLSWRDGLRKALARAVGRENSSFHVCNNDAALQSSLFSHFAAGRNPVCDATRLICQSPNWFYSP